MPSIYFMFGILYPRFDSDIERLFLLYFYGFYCFLMDVLRVSLRVIPCVWGNHSFKIYYFSLWIL